MQVRDVFQLLRGLHNTYEIRLAPTIPAFWIQSTEDHIVNTSTALSIFVRRKGGYPAYSSPSPADMEVDLPLSRRYPDGVF